MTLRNPLSTSRPNTCARSGLTLLELLVALGLMMAIIGITWLSTQRILRDQQLREVAEQVRSKVGRARLKAVDHGRIYQLRYEPFGRSFVVVPYMLHAEETDAAASPLTRWSVEGELPEGLAFHPLDGNSTLAERLDQQLLTGLENAHTLAQKQWSAGILFYPDGTATDAAWKLMDSRNQLVTFSVRGLTGHVKVSRVELEPDS